MQFIAEEQSALEPTELLKQEQIPTATTFQKDAIRAMLTWHSTPLERVIEDARKSAKDVRTAIDTFLEWCSKEDWRVRLHWLKSRLLCSRKEGDSFASELEGVDRFLERFFNSELVELLYDIYKEVEMKCGGKMEKIIGSL